MKDYQQIVLNIVQATEAIKDDKLKEIAFQKLLDHALGANLETTTNDDAEESSTKKSNAKKAKPKQSQATAKANILTIRQEVKDAFSDITPKMPGMKPLNTLKQKWEQCIWVLVVAKDKGIEEMNNNEIAYVLTEKFSIGATDKTVNNLTFKVTSGHVQKRTTTDGKRTWKVLIDGINAVKEEANDNE